jgi:hypothetical protein
LVDELDRIASLANLGGTTNWAQLNIDKEVLKEIDAATDTDLVAYRQEILRRFVAVTRPQEHLELAQLYEVYAEALVLLDRCSPDWNHEWDFRNGCAV